MLYFVGVMLEKQDAKTKIKREISAVVLVVRASSDFFLFFVFWRARTLKKSSSE